MPVHVLAGVMYYLFNDTDVLVSSERASFVSSAYFIGGMYGVALGGANLFNVCGASAMLLAFCFYDCQTIN